MYCIKKLNTLTKKRLKRKPPDNSKVLARNSPTKNTNSFQDGLNAFNNKDHNTALLINIAFQIR